MKKIVLVIITIVSFVAANLSYASDFDQQPTLTKTLSFTENKGQIVDQNFQKREDVLFGGQSNGLTFHLRTSGISYQLYRVDKTKNETDPVSKKVRTVIEQQTIYRIDVNWLNTNPTAQVKKGASLEGFDNFYTSGCLDGIHNVKSFSDVTYQNLYKGIDLKWYQKDNQLKYDYLCAAGADYKQIKIQLNGSEKLSLNKDGDLLIQTPLGTIIEQAPLVIQDGRVLKSSWILNNSVLSFHIENLDNKLPYIIDPMVRSWGSYYGGAGLDYSTNIQTDVSGNVFMTGYTSSANGTTIATVGAFQTTSTGIASDAFLVKFNASGVRQWGTYYGGDGLEMATSCAIDNSGNIYMSSDATCPTSGSMATPGSHMPLSSPINNRDLLLVKFNNSGTRIWATYYGGLSTDYDGYVSVDNNNNVFLVGNSGSTTGIVNPAATSPTTYQPSSNGFTDGFIAKFDSSGVRQWSTYFGGSDEEILTNCITDQFGNIIICGATLSSDLPVDAISPIYKGSEEAFFAKFDSSGQKLVSRYFGGSNSDYFNSVSADTTGNLYLVGTTNSDSLATVGAQDSTRSSTGFYTDGLITKFDLSGATLWASYFGNRYGSRYCKTDINGNLFVGGQSDGISNDTLVITPGAYRSVTQGTVEGSLSKWSPSGSLIWGTYYGGNKTDNITGLAFAPNNGIYICGYTTSDSSTTIASSGSHQSTYGGSTGDGFLAKIIDCSGLNLTENNRSNLSCHSGGNGAASVNVATGGISPYTYDWTGTPTGDGTLSVTGLTAGTWICTVTDSIGCYDTISFTLTAPAALGTTVPALTNVSCNGGNNGSAFVDAFGGVAPYSYVWSGSGYPFALNSNLTAGIHTCTVTDANGCIILAPVTITQPLAITSNTVSIQNVNCNGGFDGSISINAFGGSGAYSYSWTPFGGVTNNPTNLPAGSYTCTITDGNMCTKTHIVTVTQPSPLVASVASQTNVLCNGGSTGSITLNVSGGTPFYTYSWSNGGSTATISSLSAGMYSCTITDAHNCTTSIIVSVTEPASAISSSISSQTNVLCNGGSTGSATVFASGGTGALSYSWSPSGGTATTASGLIAGTYTCTITDANSCSKTQNATITQPATALSGSTAITNVSCNAGSNGAINLTATGGTAPYTFNWGGGITTEDRTGLAAGTYNVTITDANSCTALASATITQPATAVSGSTVNTNVSCNAGSTGAINLTATGGTAPYTFNWGGGITTEDRTGLSAGTYNVTITDANSCTALASATITQPAVALSGSTVVTNVSCNAGSNGAINLTATGGTAPYTFNWGGGITTEDRTGLTAGSYSVTITDANSCTAIASATITQPATALSGTTTITNVSCNAGSNGAINLTPTGGTAPYTFDWGGGITTEDRTGLAAGSYSVTITDANGCTATASATITQPASALSGSTVNTNVSCNAGSTGAINLTATGGTAPYTFNWGGGITTEDRTGLAAGTYNVTITDANSCTALASATITQPAIALSGSTAITNVSCNAGSNGAINLTATGGTAPYTFNWGGGITTEDRTGLTAGSYSVTIIDANGCIATASATITQPATALSGTTTITNVSCNAGSNGAINLTATGGTAPYTFDWGGGITTEDRTGLAAGSYSVTITDANGCSALASATITQPATALSGSTVVTNVSCNAGSTGAINLTATGGTAPYTFNWGGGITTEDRTGLAAGTYNVTITDANSCTALASATIIQPSTALSGSTVVTNVSCNAGSTGTINLTATGGTAPYTFNWGGGITTEDRTGITAGSYSVTITDANGCTAIASATITQPAVVLSGSTAITNVSCNAGSNGAINLTATGGTAPYTFNWGGGITTEDRTGLTAGTYNVTITDANGCTTSTSATVTQPAVLSATWIVTPENCYGQLIGAINLTPTGGTAPYTFNWGGGITTEDRTGLAAGSYAVTITDFANCSSSFSMTITQPTPVTVSVATVDVSCTGGSNGSINLTVTGGTAPYSFGWNSGSTAEDRTGLSAGLYSVLISDSHYCGFIDSIYITEPTDLYVQALAITNVDCFGNATGAIDIGSIGGVAPYTYNWGGGITTEDRTGLSAGTYNVTITDANSCTASTSAIVTQPASALSASWIETPVNCFGESNGQINFTALGGTGSHTFNWGGGITTEDRTGLSAGAYSVIVTDSLACAATFSISVTQPANLTSSIAITNVSCFAGSDGELDITVSGGTTPYSYFWISAITSEDLTSRSAGTYSVELSDAHGCALNDTAIITQPTEIISTSLITNVDCFGNSNGAIDIVPSGGFGPYTYNWGGGITTEDRTGLTAGNYSIAITDATSCVNNISVTVTEPIVLSATNSFVNIECFGATTGSIDLTITGGTAPYTYNWGGSLITEDLSNLPSGSYTVTVTDNHGCTTTSNATLTQPTDISIVKDSLNILCFGDNSGMANVTVSGGVGPYSYTWIGTSAFTTTTNFLTAGNYSVEITDNNGCLKVADFALSQNPAITSSFSVSQCDPYTWESNYYPTSGNYQQVFSAVNGCDSTVTLNLNVFGYPTISISASETIICAGESVVLNATGGVSTATWDNGIVNNQSFIPTTTNTYTAEISNAQGCSTSENITVFVRELPNVFMENFADSTCIDANLVACPFATPAGGIYSGNGVTGVLVNTQIAGIGQHEIIYTYADQYGCANSDTSTVTIVDCELPLNETGIAENSESGLSIYPNPSNGEFTIDSQLESTAIITDAVGRVIQTIDLTIGKSTVSILNEADGVYFILVNSNQSIHRVVKQ